MYTDTNYGYEPTTEDLQDWAMHLQEIENDYDDYPTDIDCYEEDKEDIDIDPGEMDGDHTSALRDIGWGTDEDYGYYGDCDYEC